MDAVLSTKRDVDEEREKKWKTHLKGIKAISVSFRQKQEQSDTTQAIKNFICYLFVQCQIRCAHV